MSVQHWMSDQPHFVFWQAAAVGAVPSVTGREPSEVSQAWTSSVAEVESGGALVGQMMGLRLGFMFGVGGTKVLVLGGGTGGGTGVTGMFARLGGGPRGSFETFTRLGGVPVGLEQSPV